MSYEWGNSGIYTGDSAGNALGYLDHQQRQREKQQAEYKEFMKTLQQDLDAKARAKETNYQSYEIPRPQPVDPAEAERQRKAEEARRKEEEARHQKWLERQAEIRRQEEQRKQERLEAWRRMSRKEKVLHFLWIISPIRLLLCLVRSLHERAAKRREEIWQDLNDSREFGFGLKTMRAVVAPFEKLAAQWIPAVAGKVTAGLFAILAFSYVLVMVGTFWLALPAAAIGYYFLNLSKLATQTMLVCLFALAIRIGDKIEDFIWWAEEATSRFVEFAWNSLVVLMKVTFVIVLAALSVGLFILMTKVL